MGVTVRFLSSSYRPLSRSASRPTSPTLSLEIPPAYWLTTLHFLPAVESHLDLSESLDSLKPVISGMKWGWRGGKRKVSLLFLTLTLRSLLSHGGWRVLLLWLPLLVSAETAVPNSFVWPPLLSKCIGQLFVLVSGELLLFLTLMLSLILKEQVSCLFFLFSF